MLAWSERQAELIRRLAAGERVNADIDWPHVVEEIQDVGISELRACESLLEQAFRHILKLHVWPDSAAHRHWFAEADNFVDSARERCTASIRQRIDAERLYRRARRHVSGLVPADVEIRAPEECPLTLDALLEGGVATALAALRVAPNRTSVD